MVTPGRPRNSLCVPDSCAHYFYEIAHLLVFAVQSLTIRCLGIMIIFLFESYSAAALTSPRRLLRPWLP